MLQGPTGSDSEAGASAGPRLVLFASKDGGLLRVELLTGGAGWPDAVMAQARTTHSVEKRTSLTAICAMDVCLSMYIHVYDAPFLVPVRGRSQP